MSLFPKDYDAWKRNSYMVYGEPVVSEAAYTLTGTVQPVTPRDLQQLPTGRFDTGSVKIYTEQAMTVGTEGRDVLGDLVLYSGRKYEVVHALPYEADIISHNKYFATLVLEPST